MQVNTTLREYLQQKWKYCNETWRTWLQVQIQCVRSELRFMCWDPATHPLTDPIDTGMWHAGKLQADYGSDSSPAPCIHCNTSWGQIWARTVQQTITLLNGRADVHSGLWGERSADPWSCLSCTPVIISCRTFEIVLAATSPGFPHYTANQISAELHTELHSKSHQSRPHCSTGTAHIQRCIIPRSEEQ